MKPDVIIRTYITQIRPKANEELNWFRKQDTVSEVLHLAALSINSKRKRYSHQRRLSKTVLEEARDNLLKNENVIEKCQDFDELHDLLERLLAPITGIGELYVYDTALRIGAKLDMLPTKVYLHAGTRIGAQALGFHSKTKVLEVSQLPKWLHQLEPFEIEDVLCIFKDEISNIGAAGKLEELSKRSWCA